ncbi:MAG: hypothetical protein K0R70_2243 [Steroidobacteraceae bacterium]|nr:hypothetical protein [Steroidobacteraceae bacterium]
MDRVLEAEHATASAIADAQAAARAHIEAARERRRVILETARERVVDLHERAQRRLEETLRTLDARAAALPQDDTSLAAITDAALARVAARLTSDEPA